MRELKISPEVKLGNQLSYHQFDFKIKVQSFKYDEKNKRNMRELKISPEVKLGNQIDDMIIDFKIKVQSFKYDEKILSGLLDLMNNTFSDTVKDEILKSCFDRDEVRNIKLKKILE